MAPASALCASLISRVIFSSGSSSPSKDRRVSSPTVKEGVRHRSLAPLLTRGLLTLYNANEAVKALAAQLSQVSGSLRRAAPSSNEQTNIVLEIRNGD